MQKKVDERVKVWIVRPTNLPRKAGEGGKATVLIHLEPDFTERANMKTLGHLGEIAKRRTDISEWRHVTGLDGSISVRATIPNCCRRDMDRTAAALAHLARQQFGPKVRVGEHQIPSDALFARLLPPEE